MQELRPENILPHRPPMLLVDKVVEVNDRSIKCTKLFRDDEFFVQGHYPGNPIVPGVILIEAAVQAGAIFIGKTLASGFSGVPVLTRVNDVRLKHIVKPGDEVTLVAELDEQVSSAYFMKAKVLVDDKPAARFTFACTLIEESE